MDLPALNLRVAKMEGNSLFQRGWRENDTGWEHFGAIAGAAVGAAAGVWGVLAGAAVVTAACPAAAPVVVAAKPHAAVHVVSVGAGGGAIAGAVIAKKIRAFAGAV